MVHQANPSAPSEADLAVNRALLAHAELQRNLKRLLGSADSSSIAEGQVINKADPNAGGAENGGSDEDFVAADETAGLTLATPSTAQIAHTKARQNDDILRRRLLGKRSREQPRSRRPGDRGDDGAVLKGSKPRPRNEVSKEVDESDEDEDEGRSGLGRKGGAAGGREIAVEKADITGTGEGDADVDVADGPGPASDAPATRSTAAEGPAIRKRPGSYLDEILAERAAKKNKKKKKRKGKQEVED